MIRVAVVAGVRLYRDGLCAVLDQATGVVVVAAAATVDEVVALLPASCPAVVLLDVPVSDAPAAVAALTAADAALQVVAVGVRDAEDEVLRWAEAGAAGYLSCDTGVDEVVGVVRRAAAGELECSPRIAGALLQRLGRLAAERRDSGPPSLRADDRLTRREHEVVELMARGLSNKQIARALDIRVPTVKNHVHNIFEKLDVHRRGEALARLGRTYTFDSAPTVVPPAGY